MKKQSPPLIPRPIFVKPHIRIQKSRYNPSMIEFKSLPSFLQTQIDEEFGKKNPNLPRRNWTLSIKEKRKKA